LAERTGDKRLIAAALFLQGLADLHDDLGVMFNPGAAPDVNPSPLLGAVSTLERSLAIWRELGDIGAEASTLAVLGGAYQGIGDYEQAKPLLAESARLHVRLGDYGDIDITSTLVGLMNLAANASDGPEMSGNAARIYGVLMALNEMLTVGPSPWETAEPAQRMIQKLVGVLGRNGFEQTFAEGKQLTPPEFLALVDRITAPHQPSAESPAPLVPAGMPYDNLTLRESEVLRLVAAGLSNSQVAERLIVTPRTVNAHLTAIYSKLGVASRAGAIRYALEYQLG
jgi:DNA-binding CsgD family transcriptional regulator